MTAVFSDAFETEQVGPTQRGRTAMYRATLSRPVAVALQDGVLTGSLFDYGCGRGGDVARLRQMGVDADGWDPQHRPDAPVRSAAVVNLGFVVNVIEDPAERVRVLRRAWDLALSTLVVSTRLDHEARTVVGRRHGDGVITAKGTFQRFWKQEEFGSWIEAVLGERPLAAAPGVFYVFRDERDKQALLSRRVRYRPQPRSAGGGGLRRGVFEAESERLTPLMDFFDERGRLPDPSELSDPGPIIERFGSLRAAWGVVRRATDDERWLTATDRARTDVLVYLALSAFGGRPRYGQLPTDTQRDLKAFFGSYKAAVGEADALLFSVADQAAVDAACRTAGFGKLLPDAFYAHVSGLDRLPPILRVYEGCARALAGSVDGTTIVKFGRQESKVSYLAYPEFDRDPHPPLVLSVRAHLRNLSVRVRDFSESENPPILHRKETLVPADYPGRDKFARLTTSEERRSLLSAPGIGTRAGWNRSLEEAGLRLAGHRLLRGRPLQ